MDILLGNNINIPLGDIIGKKVIHFIVISKAPSLCWQNFATYSQK